MKAAGRLRRLGCFLIEFDFMRYIFTPPHQHYDCGLGYTACNFYYAAKALSECESVLGDSNLPTCYLQRHSIELFMKSLIYILHKKYNISFGVGFSLEKPGVLLKGKWTGMFMTHDLIGLYAYFSKLFGEVSNQLPGGVNWELPKRIEEQINLIGGTDPKSDYFRYPISTNRSQDGKKSSNKEVEMGELLEKMNNGPVVTTLLVDSNDDVQNIYIGNAEVLLKVKAALDEVCDFLKSVHAAFRVEITGGL